MTVAWGHSSVEKVQYVQSSIRKYIQSGWNDGTERVPAIKTVALPIPSPQCNDRRSTSYERGVGFLAVEVCYYLEN